jgi:hypothetical protein
MKFPSNLTSHMPFWSLRGEFPTPTRIPKCLFLAFQMPSCSPHSARQNRASLLTVRENSTRNRRPASRTRRQKLPHQPFNQTFHAKTVVKLLTRRKFSARNRYHFRITVRLTSPQTRQPHDSHLKPSSKFLDQTTVPSTTVILYSQDPPDAGAWPALLNTQHEAHSPTLCSFAIAFPLAALSGGIFSWLIASVSC